MAISVYSGQDKHLTVMTLPCIRPESLFDALLDDYRIYEEIKLTRGRREPTEEDEKIMESLCQPYLEKQRKEEEV